MSTNYIDNIVEAYRQQTVQLFRQTNPNQLGMQAVPQGVNPAGFMADDSVPKMLTKDGLGENVAHSNETQVFYATDGLFADCCIEASVINLTLNPIHSLANLIPVVPSNNDKMKFGYITGIEDPDLSTLPDEPCDDDPAIGDTSACFAEFYPGRISYQTKTMELDALIQKACRGIQEDLYMLGSVRGVSAVATQQQLADRDFVKRGAVRRQMMLLGRAFQRDLIRQLWTGDPDNAALNTAGGGRKEFYGLNMLIADDYDTKSFVEGTNCESLNSDIKDFGDNCIGGSESLYAFMQTLEWTLWNRAMLQGLLPVEWVWVMHPTMWEAVTKFLPCEMLTGDCVGGSANIQIQVPSGSGNALGIQSIRNDMLNSMRIMVNGRSYPVVLDHGIPLTQEVNGGTGDTEYTSSIYLIPLRVAGEQVLYWTHRDYREFSEILSPIPQTADVGLRGWTDAGRFHFIVERDRRCFIVAGKAEFGLVFRAPHLAGRIDNVKACRMQPMDHPFPVAAT